MNKVKTFPPCFRNDLARGLCGGTVPVRHGQIFRAVVMEVCQWNSRPLSSRANPARWLSFFFLRWPWFQTVARCDSRVLGGMGVSGRAGPGGVGAPFGNRSEAVLVPRASPRQSARWCFEQEQRPVVWGFWSNPLRMTGRCVEPIGRPFAALLTVRGWLHQLYR